MAVALGMKACEQGIRTLFVTATALITTLGKALAEGKLDERLKLLSQPQLLIIDEIGYLPIGRQGANLFFQLIARRYERGSIIITSNQSLGAWGATNIHRAANGGETQPASTGGAPGSIHSLLLQLH